MAAQGRALPDGHCRRTPRVLVQGIADIVLVYPDHLELLDYKTDRRKTAADFVGPTKRPAGPVRAGRRQTLCPEAGDL